MISSKIRRLNIIASLAFMLACSNSFGEIVEGDKPDCIYLRSYAQPRTKSSQSKNLAFEKAEILAVEEFVNYALRENLILPNSLMYLEEKIKKAILLSSTRSNVIGAVTVESFDLDDGRVSCIVRIPKSNLKNFESLDTSKNPRGILDRISAPMLLKLEIALSLADKNASESLRSSSLLGRAIEGRGLNGISQYWLKDIKTEDLNSLSDRQLLIQIEDSLAMPKVQDLLLAEVKKRGYVKSAKFLAGHQVPKKGLLPDCEEFLSTLKDLEFSHLSKILIQNKCAIDFANVDIEDENFDAAKAEFAQISPDFNKIIDLIHASFLENIRDDSMNLLGRCYEEQGKLNEAMLYYFQALSINPSQAYVKWNLANTFYALGNVDKALSWAKATVGDSVSSAWSKGEAKKLIEKIENPPVEAEVLEEKSAELEAS